MRLLELVTEHRTCSFSMEYQPSHYPDHEGWIRLIISDGFDRADMTVKESDICDYDDDLITQHFHELLMQINHEGDNDAEPKA